MQAQRTVVGVPMGMVQLAPECHEVDFFRDNVYVLTKGHQGEYAAKLGLQRPSFNGMLMGRSEPEFSTVIRCAKLLGKSVDWLLTDWGNGWQRTPVRRWKDPKIDQSEKNLASRTKKKKAVKAGKNGTRRREAGAVKLDLTGSKGKK